MLLISYYAKNYAGIIDTSLLVAAAVPSEFVPAEPDTSTVGLHCIISLDRFSTLSKLFHVTAYVFRFFDLDLRSNAMGLSAQQNSRKRSQSGEGCATRCIQEGDSKSEAYCQAT